MAKAISRYLHMIVCLHHARLAVVKAQAKLSSEHPPLCKNASYQSGLSTDCVRKDVCFVERSGDLVINMELSTIFIR
ncbi:MAG TPA: hypothetical protein ACQGQI_10730, partial [Xylella sp.]